MAGRDQWATFSLGRTSQDLVIFNFNLFSVKTFTRILVALNNFLYVQHFPYRTQAILPAQRYLQIIYLLLPLT